jgi:glucitol/sorbitol PTS system EIIA component
MTTYLHVRVTAVGPDVPELVEGGVLILFGADAPPELAEVSVLHAPVGPVSPEAPPVGTPVRIGSLISAITAIGPTAWNKASDIGHIVFSFNGKASASRPGEICAQPLDAKALVSALAVGAEIHVG